MFGIERALSRSLATAILCVMSGAVCSQSYYDQTNVSYSTATRLVIPAADNTSPLSVRRLVVTEDVAPTAAKTSGSQVRLDPGELSGQSRVDEPLPMSMEHGIRNLQDGLGDVGTYAGDMAAHLQKHGLRGFFAVPSDLKEKGRAIGNKIGIGIGGIMRDVGDEMGRSQPH